MKTENKPYTRTGQRLEWKQRIRKTAQFPTYGMVALTE